MSWIQTNSGKKVILTDVKPTDIDIWDLANALSNICRFTGHPDMHYSVADHSIFCYMLANMLFPEESKDKNFLLMVLLHDAAEAYLGDSSRPLKALIPQLRDLEKPIRDAIFKSCNIKADEKKWEIVKTIDIIALVLEGELLLGAKPEEDWELDFKFSQYDVARMLQELRENNVAPVLNYTEGMSAKSTFMLYLLVNIKDVTNE